MRILLANEARVGAGGVETYLAALANALTARGHDVALLYANPAAERGPTSIATRESWSVADLGLSPALDAVRAWRPDVCFSHNMRRLDVDDALTREWPTFKLMHGYFGACVSGHKAHSFPSVEVCGRRCGPACLVYYLPRRCGRLRPGFMLEQYAWARRQQALFPRYAGIVVASDHMRREFERYDALTGRVTTIPLFTEGPASRSSGDDGAAIDIMFLGRLTPLKGADLLLDALERAARLLGREVRAVIAGEGPDRRALETRAAVLRASATVNVDLPGWIDAPARDALLARAHVLALPSRWPEPFGLVGLEAARFGVPTVAFDVGGVSTWLSDGVNGVLVPPPAGARGFGDALASVIRDPALHARLSAGALEAAAHFSAAAHVASLERVLTNAD